MGSVWDQSSHSASGTTGFWGDPTSKVNFCEKDYQITHYIAEFFNTITSLVYIAYGIHGILRYKRQNAGPFSIVNSSYWALIGVGTFSGLYHTTLKYQTQMSDELSMHVAIGTVLHQLFTFQEPRAIQRRNTAIILGIILPFVIYHCITDEFLLHVLLFTGMSVTVARKTGHLIKTRVTDKAQKRKLKFLIRIATTSSLSAFAIWNVDNIFCPTLTAWKDYIGMPWSVLLEFHAWWHIGTAVSSYCFMVLIEFLTNPEEANFRRVGFAWPAKAVMQDLMPVQKVASE